MAEAILNSMAKQRGLEVRAESAGTLPGESLNVVAVEAMDEIGVPMDGQQPKTLNAGMIARADRIITMGCGVDAAACPATKLPMEDWGLDDPAGQGIGAVRLIRDQISARVERLLDSLTD